jgi:uncharacterized protein (DUF433 family)
MYHFFIGQMTNLLKFQNRAQWMINDALLARVQVDPEVCAGRPHIRGTKIHIAIILDALTQGLTPRRIVEHYPCLELDDIRAAVGYASQIAANNGGLVILGPNQDNTFQLR